MSTSESPRKWGTSWNDLSPWDKAAQWQEVSPQIAKKVMELAEEATKSELEMDRKREAHRIAMERICEAHRQKMELRAWWAQIAAFAVGFLNVSILAVVAWHYADSGGIVPGLTVFGAGVSLTAGAYGMGRVAVRKSLSELKKTIS